MRERAMTRRRFLRALAVSLALARAAQAAPTRPSSGALRFMALRHATLLIEIASRRILVDPWLTRTPGGGLLVEAGRAAKDPEALGAVDVVLLTSSTPDRLDVGTLRALPDKRAFCLVPDERAGKSLRAAGFDRVRVVGAGEAWRVADVDVAVGRCRDDGARPGALAFHVARRARAALIAGAVEPLVVDPSLGRFARARAAEVAFLPRLHPAFAALGLAARDEDLLLVARLARARVLVPLAESVAPGPLARPLVEGVLGLERRPLLPPGGDEDVLPSMVARDGRDVSPPRVLTVDDGVWYRVAAPRPASSR